MNKQYLLSLLLLLVVIGCRKEEVIEDEQIIITPTEVEAFYLSGRVVDQLGPVPNAAIDIYQNEALINTITSDNSGNYEVKDLALRPDLPVTIYLQKDGYYDYAKRFSSSKTDADLWMTQATHSYIANGNIGNPGSDSLINLTGKVTSPSGAPIAGALVAVWDEEIMTMGGSYDIDGSVTESDNNGEFSVLVPKDIELKLFVVQEVVCQGAFNLLSKQDEFALDGLLPVELIGPFKEDTQLPVFDNASDQFDEKEVSVQIALSAQNCDNLPLVSATLQGSITIDGTTQPLQASIRDGALSIPTLNFCVPINATVYPIQINAIVKTSFSSSDSIVISSNSNIIDLGTVTVCEPPNPDVPPISFSIANQRYEVLNNGTDSIYTRISGDSLYIEAPSTANGFFSAVIPNYENQNSKIMDFRYDANPFIYRQNSNDINIIFGGVADNKYSCLFQGKVANQTTGEVENILGVFEVEI